MVVFDYGLLGVVPVLEMKGACAHHGYSIPGAHCTVYSLL